MPAEAQERTRRLKTLVARTAGEVALRSAMVSGGRSHTPRHPVFRLLGDALAGPHLRPPLPKTMDAVVKRLFPPQAATAAPPSPPSLGSRYRR